MKKLFFVIIVLLAGLSAGAQEFISHNGVVPDGYNFWIYTPEGYSRDAQEKLPLVVFLHGRSLCGYDLNKVMKYGTLDAVKRGVEVNAVVLAPQNPGGPWNPDKLINIVDWCLEEYQADPNRVYVLGMSLGGFGTMDFCGSYPDRIAAGMALCGGSLLKDYQGLSEVPLWIMHGTADKLVSVRESQRVMEKLEQTGNCDRVIYDELPGYDHGRLARCFYWGRTYDWLFKHNLQDPYRPVNMDYCGRDDYYEDLEKIAVDFSNTYHGLVKKSIPVRSYHR